MIRELTAATILLSILRGPGCGEVDHPENGANAPCTRDSDCESALRCQEGVCISPPPPPVPDAATDDASLEDAAASDAAGNDG